MKSPGIKAGRGEAGGESKGDEKQKTEQSQSCDEDVVRPVGRRACGWRTPGRPRLWDALPPSLQVNMTTSNATCK